MEVRAIGRGGKPYLEAACRQADHFVIEEIGPQYPKPPTVAENAPVAESATTQ
jgi:hypothetical protein